MINQIPTNSEKKSSPELARSFDETINLLDRLYTGTAALDETNINLLKTNFQNLSKNTQNPVIQELALKLLGSLTQITESGPSKELVELKKSFNKVLLLENFTPSISAKKNAIALLTENLSPGKENPLEVTWKEQGVTKDLQPEELITLLESSHATWIKPLLKTSVYANLIQDLIHFIERQSKGGIGSEYGMLSIQPCHIVSGTGRRQNIITKDADKISITTRQTFRAGDAPIDESELPKGSFFAAKIETEIPLKELKTKTWDNALSTVKTKYLVSKPFDSQKEAEICLESKEFEQSELLEDFSNYAENPKSNTLSILRREKGSSQLTSIEDEASGKKFKVPEQLVKDWNRMNPIICKDTNGWSEFLENSPDENLQKIELKQLDDFLEGHLSDIGELLTQTALANVTLGLSKYPLQNISNAMPEPFLDLSTEDTNKEKGLLDITTSIQATNQKVLLTKSDTDLLIEHSSLLNLKNPYSETHEFMAIKTIIQVPLEEDERSQIQAEYLVSHICKSEGEAITLMPFMQATLEHIPSKKANDPKLKKPINQNTSSNQDFQLHGKTGNFVKKAAQSLAEDSKRAASKFKKPGHG